MKSKIENLEVYTINNVMPQYMEKIVKRLKVRLHKTYIMNDKYCFTACKPIFNKKKFKRDASKAIADAVYTVKANLTQNMVAPHKIEEICNHIESFKSILI